MKYTAALALLLFSAHSFASNINTQALQACALIENDFKRLMCYDKVVANKPINKAVTKTTNTVKDNDFGLEHKVTKKVLTESEISTTVSNIKKSQTGTRTLTLDNKQVWKQIGSGYFAVKKGDKVIIERGVLDSFLLKVAGSNKTIRVKRIK